MLNLPILGVFSILVLDISDLIRVQSLFEPGPELVDNESLLRLPHNRFQNETDLLGFV
jgi:hypothetical protein